MKKPPMEYPRLLAEASRQFASSLDYETTLSNAARLTVEHLADWCVVDLFTDGPHLRRLAVAHADPSQTSLAERLKKFHLSSDKKNPYVADMLSSGKPIVTPEVTDVQLAGSAQNEEHLALLREFRMKSRVNMPLISRGKPLGILSVGWVHGGREFRITDLPMIEELSQRMAQAIDNSLLYRKACEAIQTREEFISVASHELKTPLTALCVRLEMLLLDLESVSAAPKLKRDVEICIKQSQRMKKLIQGVFEFTRVEHAQFDLVLEETCLDSVILETIERFNPEKNFDRSQISLEIRTPDKVFLDPGRFEQVLTNLISNAMKYGEGKPIHICASTRSRDGFAEISVRDQGKGIPSEFLPRIFERFERARTTGSLPGLGLGLYISKKIIENHGGTICVHSVPGEGSTFTVELPLKPQ